jgi:shikimate dehydrogenase
MDITAGTLLYGIFGKPAKHSLSPIMHNAAFRHASINAVYLAFEPPTIEDALHAMKALSMRGASVTIPFKTDVLHFIDDIDPLAQKIGAVNTLVQDETHIIGYNTDGIGALRALERVYPSIQGAKVLIIGNGGAARAIAFTLLEEGCSVTISGRNSIKHGELVNELQTYSKNVFKTTTTDLIKEETTQYKIIINTTSLGMKPDSDPLPLAAELLHKDQVIFDIVYTPHNTPLLKNAVARGCIPVYGIDMLLYQGVEQFSLWFQQPAPEKIMKDVLQHTLNGQQL